MKTSLLIIIGLIFEIVFLPTASYASCAAPPPLGSEFYNFQNADLVFVGTVTSIYNPHPEFHTGTEEYDTITFDVSRVLKGNIGDGTVTSGHHSAGYRDFEVGKSYQVYAFGAMRDVSACTPPILLSEDHFMTIHEVAAFLPILLIVSIAAIPAVIILKKRK